MCSKNQEKQTMTKETGSQLNLEANIEQEFNTKRKSHGLRIVVALVGATIAFYALLVVVLFCCYPKAVLLALITDSRFDFKYNYFRNQWIEAKEELIVGKPKDASVVAVVAYRNRERSAILDCYLRRNLVEYGGLLDEVILVPETSDLEHLQWLQETVNSTQYYSIHPSIPPTTDSRSIFIKIDGDVVFIQDNVIRQILATRFENPERSFVFANVVQEPVVAKFHNRPVVAVAQYDVESRNSQCEKTRKYAIGNGCAVLSSSDSASTSGSNSPVLSHAQQHKVFLDRLEHSDLHSYKFPLGNPSSDISDVSTIVSNIESDEESDDPTSLLRSSTVLINAKGVVSHYDENAAMDELDASEILDRYRNYAVKHVCCR